MFEVRLRGARQGEWRTFREPTRIVEATEIAQVADCLADVERAVRQDGCYAAGYLTYEAAAAFGLPAHDRLPDGLPLACFGLFNPRSVEYGRLTVAGRYRTGPWEPSLDRHAYADAIGRIKALIEAGETYQINFTFRLDADFTGDPLALLRDLDAAQDGSWGACVDGDRFTICSASPELLYRRHGDLLECRPMKGTASRGLWPADDRARGEGLRASPKNRAENVMVVDMVRNDLGRIARTGSVETPSLFDVERYPLQWQMTSSVRARSDAGFSAVLGALFPSGSVTGAPKHRSMSIIRDLEPSPRGIYTGAIGYLSPHGRQHFSVAIRTVTIDKARERAEFGVGSGIVWDSAERDEYDECRLKASILLERPRFSYATGARPDFRLLETIGWTPLDGFALLPRHLARLRESAECFRFAYDLDQIRAMLDTAVGDLIGPSKIRVLVSQDGTIVCEGIDRSPPPEGPLQVSLAADPIDPTDVFLFHKTTRRGVYERARASRPDRDTVLLWNPDGDVTEATEANLVVRLDAGLLTPPVASGLLPGVLRAELLESGTIAEQQLTIADVRGASELWLINSVRGWMPATLLP